MSRLARATPNELLRPRNPAGVSYAEDGVLALKSSSLSLAV